jgi:hypothetical protein
VDFFLDEAVSCQLVEMMATTAGLSPAETGTLLTASEVYRADAQRLYRSGATAHALTPALAPRQPSRLPPIADAPKPNVGAGALLRGAFAPLPALSAAKDPAASIAPRVPQQLLPSLLDSDDICNWRTMTVGSSAAVVAAAQPGAADAHGCAVDEAEAMTAMWRTFTLRQDDAPLQRASGGDPSRVLERA